MIIVTPGILDFKFRMDVSGFTVLVTVTAVGVALGRTLWIHVIAMIQTKPVGVRTVLWKELHLNQNWIFNSQKGVIGLIVTVNVTGHGIVRIRKLRRSAPEMEQRPRQPREHHPVVVQAAVSVVVRVVAQAAVWLVVRAVVSVVVRAVAQAAEM
jgi:hypothetical protein